MSPNSLKHFHKLYDQRKHKSPRMDRSPIDIEYDRTKNDCKFKPEFFTKESKRAVSPRYMNKPEVQAKFLEAPGPHQTKMISNYTSSKVKRPEGKNGKERQNLSKT